MAINNPLFQRSSPSQQPESETPTKDFALKTAKIIFVATGMAPILKAMTTISTHLGNIRAKNFINLIPKQRAAKLFDAVVTDFARQLTTCSFQLVSYFVAGDIIKAILKQHYAKKPATNKNLALQQMWMQLIPLYVQVVATIFSRGGAGHLQRFLQVNADGQPIVAKQTWLYRGSANFINTVLRYPMDHKTQAGLLRPMRAAVVGTGVMAVCLGSLAGILFGISTELEKQFPHFFKTDDPIENKKKTKPGNAQLNVLPAPMAAIPPPVMEPLRTLNTQRFYHATIPYRRTPYPYSYKTF